MLIDISRLQEKLQDKLLDIPVETSEIPVLIQQIHANIAAMVYCAQKIEWAIKEVVYTPSFSLTDAHMILADQVAGIHISQCLDELCDDPRLGEIVDVSVDVAIKPGNKLYLSVLPIYDSSGV